MCWLFHLVEMINLIMCTKCHASALGDVNVFVCTKHAIYIIITQYSQWKRQRETVLWLLGPCGRVAVPIYHFIGT